VPIRYDISSNEDSQSDPVELHTNLKILTWNINGGFSSKLSDTNFNKYIFKHDIIVLTECWIENNFTCDIKDYQCKFIPRSKSKGKQGGGMVILIRNTVCEYVEIVNISLDTVVWLKIDKNITAQNIDIYMCCVYIPPSNSVFYQLYECDDLFDTLINEIVSFSSKGSIIMLGDLNSRCAQNDDFISCDVINSEVLHTLSNIFDYNNDGFLSDRYCPDKVVNSNGSKLLQLCKSCSLRILNGRYSTATKYTYFGPNGCSVVDYVLANEILFSEISSFVIDDFQEHSDHAPLFFTLKVKNEQVLHSCNSREYNHICIKWNEAEHEAMATTLNENKNNLDTLFETLHDNVESITNCVKVFTKILDNSFEQYTKRIITCQLPCTTCSACAKNNPTLEKGSKPWFTKKCVELYRAYKQALNDFNRNYSNENRSLLITAKQVYKQAVNKAKKKYKHAEGDMLNQMRKENPKAFYKKFKRQSWGAINISADSFRDHFEKLANKEAIQAQSVDHHKTGDVIFEELDAPFTDDEIHKAIQNLKVGKSPGTDSLINEYFIKFKNILTPYFCKLFNIILETGYTPEIWSEGIIVPLHKKGDVGNVNNYRGITLLSHMSKLFTSTLNKRLINWSNKYNVITDAQLGFKPGFGTTDAIFALKSLINNTLSSKRKRLYCCFIDYSKAFDSIVHDKLWLKLFRSGISGKMLQVIKSIYKNVKSCVRVNGKFSDFFKYNCGLMQGESLSPILFSLFVNDLENEFLFNNYCDTYELRNLNLSLLMYADDTVLFSESVEGLQHMLNLLNDYVTEWDLDLNISKTKIVIFRNGGKVKDNEKWYYRGQLIEVVNKFNYLGILFNYNGSSFQIQKKLSEQGRKAMFALLRNIKDLNLNIETQLSLFDTYVCSIMNYASEVWGHHTGAEIEKVHTDFCKYIIKVRKSASHNMVYSELGRYPIYIKRKVRIIKYWFKLLKTNNCILRSCYDQQYTELLKGKSNWLNDVKSILSSNGYGVIWLQQSVDNEKLFLSSFENRLKDCFIQHLLFEINEASKCILYKNIIEGSDFGLQFYLQKNIDYKFQLCKFRISAHRLAVETGRYSKIERKHRVCKNCEINELEDEYHFILVCKKFVNLRSKYIKMYYWKNPSVYKLVQLFNSKNIKTLNNLGKYLYIATRSCN
jgi:exonuclease III